MVEGAALEMLCRGNSTVGSNPTLSAIFLIPLLILLKKSSLEQSGAEDERADGELRGEVRELCFLGHGDDPFLVVVIIRVTLIVVFK